MRLQQLFYKKFSKFLFFTQNFFCFCFSKKLRLPKIFFENFYKKIYFYFYFVFQKSCDSQKFFGKKNLKSANSRRLTRVFGGSIPGGRAGLFRSLKCTEKCSESIAKPGNLLLALWDAVRRRLAQRVEYRARSARMWGSGGVAPRKINGVLSLRRFVAVVFTNAVSQCGVRCPPTVMSNVGVGAFWTPCAPVWPRQGSADPQQSQACAASHSL